MATQPEPVLACIIVTYNGAPWLPQCLDSIQQSTVSARIIVVDNASQDETVAIVRSHRGVELIETGANLGFGRANNIGIARALDLGAEHVFLLNQDAHVATDALELLLRLSAKNPTIGILCPMQLDAEGRATDPTFLRYYLAVHASAMLDDALLGRPLKTQYTVAAAPAAAWLLTRRFLKEVGGFDPLFFMYCEDDDLCSRACHHGYQVAVVPAALFYHGRGFHSQVKSETRSLKIRRKTSRLRSSLVRDIKQPSGKIWKNAWHALSERSLLGLTALLSHLNWIEAYATLMAVLQVLLFELPAIFRHRRKCLEKGPHWLPGPPHPRNSALKEY